MGKVGARGYPSAVLVNPMGEIVFSGHPAEIDDAKIEAAIVGALEVPIFAWAPELSKAASAMRAERLGEAIAEVKGAKGDFENVLNSLIAMIGPQMTKLEVAMKDGDYLRVKKLGLDLERAVEDREEAPAVAAMLKDITKDRDKRIVLNAQEKIEKMFSKPIKKNRVKKLIKDLEKLRDKHPDTIVDRDVDRAIARLLLID